MCTCDRHRSMRRKREGINVIASMLAQQDEGAVWRYGKRPGSHPEKALPEPFLHVRQEHAREGLR